MIERDSLFEGRGGRGRRGWPMLNNTCLSLKFQIPHIT